MDTAQNPKSQLNIPTSKFLVVGLGTSGYWAARWLAEAGAKVTLSDIKERSQLDPEYLKELHALGVTLETGGHHEETFLCASPMNTTPFTLPLHA